MYATILFLVLFIPRLSINKWDVLVLCLFYVVPFLWVVISAVHCFVMDSGFIAFVPTTIGRMANYCVYLCMYLAVRASWQQGLVSTESLLSAYSYGCIVLLVLGWWQLAHYIFGIPFLDVETRNFIHSMDGNIGLGFRVTSIAEEPAYLVPYLIDLFIIVFYKAVSLFSKRASIRILILGGIGFLLLFTLSLSGYCNFLLIIIIICISMKRTKKKLVFSFVLLVLFILGVYFVSDMVFAVIQRLNPEDLFTSGRLQDGYLPIFHMLSDVSPFTLLFGYGPKGFDYMRRFVFYIRGWLTGKPISITSHIIFIDFFVEYGFIGVLLLIVLFFLLLYIAKKTYKYGGGRIVQVLVINYIISSFFTSDYASPRCTIIFVLCICMYLEQKRKNYNENHCNYTNL